MRTVFDEGFKMYGRVLDGYDFKSLIQTLEGNTDKPLDGVIYVPSDETLEKEEVYAVIQDNVYGGMPIQLGYCNGHNTKLNCLEYHRDSEVNIVADDVVFLLAPQQKIVDCKIESSCVESFLCPTGTAVEFYATTLHYAPCTAPDHEGFRVVVVLPRGTNTDKPNITPQNAEDRLLWARNKWLIAHTDTNEAKVGAFVGIIGENIDISKK